MNLPTATETSMPDSFTNFSTSDVIRILTELPLGVCVLDHDHNLLWANEAYEAIFGYKWHKIAKAKERYRRIFPCAQYELKMQMLRDRKNFPALELRVRTADGSRKTIEIRQNVLSDGKILMTVVDMTEKCREVENLSRLADTDSLTGIPNRRCFYTNASAEVNRAIRFHRPLSVLMFDVDHFKKVNDTYGHLAGDSVLRTVAHTLRAGLREHDLFGRIGGEEFAALLVESDLEKGLQSAERLRALLEAIVIPCNESTSIRITVSIGATDIDACDERIEDLLQRADTALYDAKQSGRNCVRAIWSPDSVSSAESDAPCTKFPS